MTTPTEILECPDCRQTFERKKVNKDDPAPECPNCAIQLVEKQPPLDYTKMPARGGWF